MSDGGDLNPRRAIAKTRSEIDVLAAADAAVAAEREAVVEHLRRKIAAAQAAQQHGKIDEADAAALITRLDIAADEIGQGLHRDG